MTNQSTLDAMQPRPFAFSMKPILLMLLLQLFLVSTSTALECYVCKNQEGNVEKCLNTIKTCEPGEDTCLTETKWSSAPYWTQTAKKQYYFSKRCSTTKECAAIRKSYMFLCSHIGYLDWLCSDCCQGDRCNYYVISGTSKLRVATMTLMLPIYVLWRMQ